MDIPPSPAQPVFVGSYQDGEQDRVRYEHPATQGEFLYAARHRKGVEVISIADLKNPHQIAVIRTENAWATLPDSGFLFIADGDGEELEPAQAFIAYWFALATFYPDLEIYQGWN